MDNALSKTGSAVDFSLTLENTTHLSIFHEITRCLHSKTPRICRTTPILSLALQPHSHSVCKAPIQIRNEYVGSAMKCCNKLDDDRNPIFPRRQAFRRD